jgi:hypothetical protein
VGVRSEGGGGAGAGRGVKGGSHIIGVPGRGRVLSHRAAAAAATAAAAAPLLPLLVRGEAPLHFLNLKALIPRELRVGLLEERQARLLRGLGRAVVNV